MVNNYYTILKNPKGQSSLLAQDIGVLLVTEKRGKKPDDGGMEWWKNSGVG